MLPILKKYLRETMFSPEPSVYSQRRYDNIRTKQGRRETEQYWRSIWEKKPHNNGLQWVVELRAKHRDFWEQDPATTEADSQERVSGIRN